MEEIKFTEEELNSLSKLQDELNNIILRLGQLSVEEINVKNAADQLVSERTSATAAYDELRKKERELAAVLNEKYGPGTLNPKTGVFIPASTPAAN